MSPILPSRPLLRLIERWAGVLLGTSYVCWLLATANSLGYARDEGFYFYAAGRYQEWFELLLSSPRRALEPAVLDYHWSVNREHPALIKSLFAGSHWLFFEKLGWFAQPGTAYRFVGMVLAGVTLATVYTWGKAVLGVAGAVVAAACLALMPRIFYHSHLSCFDIPVAALWLLTAFAYARSLADDRWRWALATGLLYGLLLNTKHNSWLLPPVLLLHFLSTAAWRSRQGSGLSGASKALLCLGLMGPLIFYAGWPWIWRDSWARLLEYFQFHMAHDYYNMEFLGQTYHEPPMPRSYAWVMTLATVPGTTLLLFGLGGIRAVRIVLVSRAIPFAVSLQSRLMRSLAREAPNAGGGFGSRRGQQRGSVLLLWGLCLLASYAPWWSTDTPIFGGTKHWITAYPFMALFAGLGLSWTLGRLKRSLRQAQRKFAGAALLVAVLLPSLVMTLESHPFGLSTYTPLVGGAPGAASLGLNRTFWGYTTGSVSDYLNENAPGGAALYLHDTARTSFSMLQRDGRLRSDIVPTLDIARSNLALYHHEPHMSRVEYQIWVDYGTLRPAVVRSFHGVPIVWLYRRPP